MGLFAAVDKVQLATGELYGFSKDTGLVGQQYSWLGSILSLGVRSAPSSALACPVSKESLTKSLVFHLLDVGWYLAIYIPHSTPPGWQILECMLNVLVHYDLVHCGLPQLGWFDGFALPDGIF